MKSLRKKNYIYPCHRKPCKYTKNDRVELAHIFREAPKHMWDGHSAKMEDVIKPNCMFRAIDKVFAAGECSRKYAVMAEDLILARLGEDENGKQEFLIAAWLANHGHIPSYSEAINYRTEIQEYRHAWFNALAEEFSS